MSIFYSFSLKKIPKGIFFHTILDLTNNDTINICNYCFNVKWKMEQWNQFTIQLFFKHARLCTRLINITKLAVWFCSDANHHAGWSRGHDLHIYQQKDGLKRKTKKPQLLGVRTHPYFLFSWYHFPEEKSKALKYSFHNFAQNYIMICILFHLIDEMKNRSYISC